MGEKQVLARKKMCEQNVVKGAHFVLLGGVINMSYLLPDYLLRNISGKCCLGT